MAIAERYVDDSANGSATAGGSSAGAPKASGTGWTRDGGAGTKVITLAGTPDLSGVTGSASVGDLVYLASATGGYNTTWFKVISVDDATDKLTLHADPGAGDAAYVWNIGGAVTLAVAVAISGAECVAAGDATAVGVRWNIKKQTTGNYANTTTTLTIANGGAKDCPLIWQGYSSTIGDLAGASRSAATGLLITTNFPSITFTTGRLYEDNKTNMIFYNLIFSNAGSTNSSLHLPNGSAITIVECSISGSGSGNAAYSALTCAANGSLIINSDITNTATTARGAVTTGSSAGVTFVNCMISCTNGSGIHNYLRAYVFDCIIFNSSVGITNGSTDANSITQAVQCTFYACTTIHAAPNVSLNPFPIFVSCLCTDCGSGFVSGYAATGELAILRYKNRTRDITTMQDGYDNWPDISPVTTDGGDASTDYVNAAGGDFRLIPSSPGKLAGVWPNQDIGAMPPIDISKPRPQIIGA